MQWIQMLLHITLITANQRSAVICMKHINKGFYLHVVIDINFIYFFSKRQNLAMNITDDLYDHVNLFTSYFKFYGNFITK